MKIYFLLFVQLISCLIFGAAHSQPVMGKIIINNKLNSLLFDDDRIVTTVGVQMAIIKNETTGKTDTTGPLPTKDEVVNCQIRDTGRNHYGFDNCMAFAFFTNDTLVLQFQNNNIETPKFDWWDRLIIHIIGDQFYAEYVYTNKSPYQLKVSNQELTLQRWTKKRGEQIKGKLFVKCANNSDRKRAPKIVTFSGFFNAKIE